MNYPLIKGLANKSKRGINLQNKILYDQNIIFIDSMLSEIDAIITLNTNKSMQNTLNIIDKMNFDDARS